MGCVNGVGDTHRPLAVAHDERTQIEFTADAHRRRRIDSADPHGQSEFSIEGMRVECG